MTHAFNQITNLFSRITFTRCKLFFIVGTFVIVVTGTIKDGAEATDLDTENPAVRFEIEINDTATGDDDYFCWTPTPARIRMIAGTEPVTLTISSRSLNNGTGGEVVFQKNRGTRPTASSFDPMSSIELVVEANNENWTPFWVAGRKASTQLKDTEIVVTRDDHGLEVAVVPVMVRVRKNATKLNAGEIKRLLKALNDHHDLANGGLASRYEKYVRAHEKGFGVGIHRNRDPRFLPLFLAWHRAFLLSIERELQEFDASVTLPYWRFDRDDPSAEDENRIAIFTPDFMGTVSGELSHLGSFIVEFSEENPLSGWQVRNEPLTRDSNGIRAVIPRDRLDALFHENGALGRRSTYQFVNSTIEFRYHNGAHREIGGALLRQDSPADPLFFLLHANVDRAWALWQEKAPEVRFNRNNSDAYHAQGTYPGPGTNGSDRPYRKGSYSDDLMWPWGGTSGRQDNDDRWDDRPDIKFDMPLGPGVGGKTNRPSPGDMIDYLDTRGTGTGIGVCYDRIKFR